MNKKKVKVIMSTNKRIRIDNVNEEIIGCEYKKTKIQELEYKCNIFLSGVSNNNFIIYLSKEYFILCDSSSIYTEICSIFPENNWVDMIIKNIDYLNEYEVNLYIQTI